MAAHRNSDLTLKIMELNHQVSDICNLHPLKPAAAIRHVCISNSLFKMLGASPHGLYKAAGGCGLVFDKG